MNSCIARSAIREKPSDTKMCRTAFSQSFSQIRYNGFKIPTEDMQPKLQKAETKACWQREISCARSGWRRCKNQYNCSKSYHDLLYQFLKNPAQCPDSQDRSSDIRKGLRDLNTKDPQCRSQDQKEGDQKPSLSRG